jgi:hypothetical protein
VLAEIEQLAVPGDHPQLRRDPPLLERVQVDDLHRRVELHRPAPLRGPSAERDLFIVEKEILVHPT